MNESAESSDNSVSCLVKVCHVMGLLDSQLGVQDFLCFVQLKHAIS